MGTHATSRGVRVGPLVLEHELGRGGSAVVWQARHRGGATVAVKFLLHDRCRNPAWVDALQREVRAVAALDHPHVVEVYDYGLVEEADAPAPPGTPMLVMEAGRDQLGRHLDDLDWAAVRSVGLRLLDALAHAHAHGVIHRDLKPENVLLGCGGSVLPLGGLRLADFSLATAPGTARGRAGTPSYMAPEQGTDGHVGPWTDLYALGVLLWRACTGELPYDGRDVDLLLARKLSGRPLPFAPRFAVPLGLEEGLRRLIAPLPDQRPDSAASVAAWLRALGAPDRAPTPAPPAPRAPEQASTVFLGPGPTGVSLGGPPVPGGAPVDLPADWHRDRGPRALPLDEVGLGILDLRPPPFVGRTTERDALWARLRALASPTLLRLTGPIGSGRRRLADQVAVRAAETGAVHLLRGPIREAVSRLVGRPWGARALLVRLGAGADHAEPLAAWLSDDGPAPVAALTALLDGLSRGRRVVWRVDAEEVGLAARVIDALPPSSPVLALVPADDDAPGPRVAVLPVGPLPPTDARTLLRDVLSLSVLAAERIADAAEGLPGVLLAIVRDLSARGALVPGPSGYELVGAPRLPEAVVAPWRARLDRALDGRTDALAGLERAALLDPPVERARWRALGVDDDALAALVEAGLVRPDPDPSFAHPAVRAALVDRARVGGRLEAHHRAIAATFAAAPALRGAHLLRAGDAAGALDPLLFAAEAAHREGRHRRVERLLADALRAADAVPLDPERRHRLDALVLKSRMSHARLDEMAQVIDRYLARLDLDEVDARIEVLVNWICVLRRHGRADDAWRAAEVAHALADRASPRARMRAALTRAQLLSAAGGPGALDDLRAARALAVAVGSREHVCQADLSIAQRLIHEGRREGLDAILARLEAALDRVGPSTRLNVGNNLGLLHAKLRDLDAADRVLARTSALAAELGQFDELAWCLLVRAGVLEQRGERERALASLREGIRWRRTLGGDNPLMYVTLAQFLTRRGLYDEAAAELAVAERGPATPLVRVAWSAERAWLAACCEPEAAVTDRLAALEAAWVAYPTRSGESVDAWTRIAAACEERGLVTHAARARAGAARAGGAEPARAAM